MNETKACNDYELTPALIGREIVRLVVFIVVYSVSGQAGIYLPRWLGVPQSSPGDDPPWYFIRQDFFTGVGFLIGLLLLGVFLALTWRCARPASNWLLVMMAAIWMVPGTIASLLIYIRCTDFFNYAAALSPWQTFDDYLQDRRTVGTAMLVVALAVAMLIPFIPWLVAKTMKQMHQPCARTQSESSSVTTMPS